MTEMAHEQNRTERITYKDSTYEIVSKVAYLIGVPKRIFEMSMNRRRSMCTDNLI